MESVVTNSGPNWRVKIELLQTNWTALRLFLCLYRYHSHWHNLIKKQDIYLLLLCLIGPRDPLFFTINNYDKEDRNNNKQSPCHIA